MPRKPKPMPPYLTTVEDEYDRAQLDAKRASLATRVDPLVTVARVSSDMGRCHACPITLDAARMPESVDGTIVEILFYTGRHSAMSLHYCETHYAQVVTALIAAAHTVSPGA